MTSYHTMNHREEAAWMKAVLDGTLFPYRDEYEASEQMWLSRQAGALLKEIALMAGLTTGAVWARVKNYEARNEG